MAIKTFIVVLLSLALLSCGIFFMTPFPANLALTEKVADLRKVVNDIPGECEDCYYLHFLNGYLFLVIQDSQLIILDADLNVLKDYTNESAYGSLGFYNPGTAEYSIGFRQLDSVFVDTGTPSILDNNGHGYYDPVVLKGRALRSWDDTLETVEYPPWVTLDSVPGTIPYDLQLRGLTYNPLSSLVYLFFGYDWHDDDGAEVIQVLNTTVSTGLSALGFYPFGSPIITLDGVDARHSYFTRVGFVGLSEGVFRKFDLAGNEESTLRGGRIRRQAAAFDIDGTRFFYYDGDAKKIYRCSTWWE